MKGRCLGGVWAVSEPRKRGGSCWLKYDQDRNSDAFSCPIVKPTETNRADASSDRELEECHVISENLMGTRIGGI